MSLEEEEEEDEDGAAAVAVSGRRRSAGNLANGNYVRWRTHGEPEKSALAVHLQIYIGIHRLERNITSRD
jgi:hypothetical protein